jgi:hypothetical protein
MFKTKETHEGEQSTWVVNGTYRDRLVRTADGWKIAERTFRGYHTEGELLPRDRFKSFPVPATSRNIRRAALERCRAGS